jgi:hypothetical protein
MTTLSTTWSMVINNPDENDFAIVTAGYPDYVRELIWTEEVGKDGTPHIQAYVKLQRSQRMSFIKKLFPRGHFKPCDRDEYNLNTKRYVQKNDDTTAGQHRQMFNDPIPAADTLLYSVVKKALGLNGGPIGWLVNGEFALDLETAKTDKQFELDEEDWRMLKSDITSVEADMVTEKAHLEKLLVSPTYSRIKKTWLREIATRLINNAYDNACIEQDAGRQVGRIDFPVTESGSEGSPDSDGEDDSNSEQDSEASDSEGD